jgi:hypothetical protein
MVFESQERQPALPTRELARRALPMRVLARQALPTRERREAPLERTAAKPLVREPPTKGLAHRLAARAARSSSVPAWREATAIPTSEAAQMSRPTARRAIPPLGLVLPRGYPTPASWSRILGVTPPAGPSLVTRAEERLWSARPGWPASRRLVEPRSRRHRRSGWSATRASLEAPPSCACGGAEFSSKGRRRTGQLPPGLCLRIQLASGRELLSPISACFSDLGKNYAVLKYGTRYSRLWVTGRPRSWSLSDISLDHQPSRCNTRHCDVRLQRMCPSSQRLSSDDVD